MALVLIKQRGFLLFEACISLLLVALCATILSMWYSHFIEEHTSIKKRVHALLYASSLLEYIRVYKAIPKHQKHKDYSVQWNVVPDTTIPSFKHITVTVTWAGRRKNSRVHLSTGAVIL